MGLMLQALGLKLLAVEDEQALAKIRPMLTPRKGEVSARSVPWGRSGTQFVVSRRWVKRMAREGHVGRSSLIVASLLPKQQALTDEGGGPITVTWLPPQS
jgi:hypothetical protein